LLESQLGKDRGSPLPHVPRLAPREHFALHRCGIVAKNWPHAVRRDVVDVVPPCASYDDFLIKGHCGWRLKRIREFVAGERNGYVTLFAEFRAAPKRKHL